ncbi:hypothetical protein [Streptomyces yerevanensis]|uniref:hypothetical protein n=1 Tax=Streptomyces yerevanensis TaxID=66378 RepID=UPI001FE10D35|nr:hypothetical protein [Streptomyces yerevanensis]
MTIEPMPFLNHQELDVTVMATSPVGAQVESNGEVGFVDQAKHPSWWNTEVPPPRIGDRLHVVVLDASRNPARFSALDSDIQVARELRSR